MLRTGKVSQAGKAGILQSLLKPDWFVQMNKWKSIHRVSLYRIDQIDQTAIWQTFGPLLQPGSRNKLEENQRRSFPQQGENEEFKRRPGNTQFPAGRFRHLWMYSGESARQKCGAGSHFIPRWANPFQIEWQWKRQGLEQIFRTGNSSLNPICLFTTVWIKAMKPPHRALYEGWI